MKISRYLTNQLVVFLDVEDRAAAIEQMIEYGHKSGRISDKEAFRKALLERERVVSTAVGMGIAIPHAKLADYEEFFIIIGILAKGIEWQAIDGTPVRLIFMVGGPDDKQTEYLQLLSSLTLAVKDEERRRMLLTEKSAERIVELFKAY